MSILFPVSLDTFVNPTPTDQTNVVPHAQQHANANDAILALERKVGINGSADTSSLDYLVNALVPVGAILLWSGTIATIPARWALCDGTAGTPDLRDKFVVGATSDSGGVAKSNIEGSLKQTGGVTGHSHSQHANLTHAGMTIGDHTGLTHGLTIADHPALTHAAITFPGATLSHADISVPSANAAMAAFTLTHADHSLASFSGTQASNAAGSAPSGSVTIPSGTHSHAASTNTGSVTNTVTRSVVTTGGLALVLLSPSNSAGLTDTMASFSGTHASQSGTIASAANLSIPSATHSHAASTVTHADHSVAAASATIAAKTLTQPAHTIATGSQAIADHPAQAHTFTAPAAHGVAGTLTHSFSEPNDHVISAHDTVSTVPNYFALAYIMRVS